MKDVQNDSSDPIAQAESELMSQIQSNASVLAALPSSASSELQSACGQAISVLQGLNAMNLSADMQELIQANLAVLQQLQSEL